MIVILILATPNILISHKFSGSGIGCNMKMKTSGIDKIFQTLVSRWLVTAFLAIIPTYLYLLFRSHFFSIVRIIQNKILYYVIHCTVY